MGFINFTPRIYGKGKERKMILILRGILFESFQ
jgi:hypothetical protein